MSRMAKIVCFAVVVVALHCWQSDGLIAAGSGEQQGGGSGFERTDVFVAGELGYKEFRIPALVVTKGGTLLAISEAGWTLADAGDRDILLRRSTDGGRTWSQEVQLILDRGKSRCGSPACLIDTKTGRIHLLAAVDSKKALHTNSDDDGRTWSEFVDVTGPFEALRTKWAWTRFDTGPARGIELTRGKYKGRFVQPIWLSKGQEQYRSGVIYSDDRGMTWKPGGLINEVQYNTNECSVYEAVDDTLWMNIRGGDSLPSEGRKPYRLIATSTDGGLSWSRLRHDENLIGPRCLASTVRYSWPEEGRSRVLFANPADEKHRIKMTVRLSYDDGRSWPVAKQIFAGPSAYSCLARLPDGDIGLLYERGEKYRYEKMTFARFTLEWLTDGKDRPSGKTAATTNMAVFPAGKKYTNSIGMKFVRIPRKGSCGEPGSFMMGQQQGGDWDERPVHKVNITKPFYMTVTEVTNEQYERFDPQHKKYRGRWGLSKNDDEAVIFVSWNEAIEFCQWLSKKERKPCRLPTEAEWEYACRAGTTGPYNTGDKLPEVYHKSQKRAKAPQQVDLTVGRTPANPWGLYDMHSNVEEWCYDWYGPYLEGQQTDPVGWYDGDFKVTRGGSHNTQIRYLRSANRLGTMPKDKHWLIGFRVVLGDMPPPARPVGAAEVLLWGRNVSEKKSDWSDGPDPAKPYFSGPEQYMKVPPNSNGPMFSRHNHDPALTWCDNGDLLAIWYSCNSERGRELCVLASRLRQGSHNWDDAAPFWDAPDRNDHAPALLNDGEGTLYHFNGLSVAASYRKNLALVMRSSRDNGVTWSKGRLINPVRGISNQPVASAIVTREGYLVFTSDWPWHKDGGGSALWISRDKGRTWTTPVGRIAGIHAGVTQLNDGRLMALGRGSDIDGRMPKSISADMGESWSYEASPFPPIGGGQRLVLLRLKEGPLFFASFARDMTITDTAGQSRRVKGLFGALSFDEGETWPLCRLITPGDAVRKAKQMDGREFTLGPTSAEPAGYMTGIQTPDGVINLISSWNHYAFNLAWLKTPAPIEKQ